MNELYNIPHPRRRFAGGGHVTQYSSDDTLPGAGEVKIHRQCW